MSRHSSAGKPAGDRVRIASLALSSPTLCLDQEQALEMLTERYAGHLSPRSLDVMRRVMSHPSVRRRRFAFESTGALFDETPDERIDRFTSRAVDLSAEAATEALESASVDPSGLAGIVVNTCTGYVCPGLSTYLVERLGLDRHLPSYDLVGAGCGGAIPNIETAAGILARHGGGSVLSVSVEICSATFQMGDDLGLIISNAIFADGAAAAVLSAGEGGGGVELLDSARSLAPEHRELIRYVYKGGQLQNQLAPGLPRKAGAIVSETIHRLLDPHGLTAADIRHWAVHPGGEKVLAAIGDALGLGEGELAPSRRILAEYGNMSSATVWYVLRELLSGGVEPGGLIVMLAFGAGMSAHGALLKAT